MPYRCLEIFQKRDELVTWELLAISNSAETSWFSERIEILRKNILRFKTMAKKIHKINQFELV